VIAASHAIGALTLPTVVVQIHRLLSGRFGRAHRKLTSGKGVHTILIPRPHFAFRQVLRMDLVHPRRFQQVWSGRRRGRGVLASFVAAIPAALHHSNSNNSTTSILLLSIGWHNFNYTSDSFSKSHSPSEKPFPPSPFFLAPASLRPHLSS
jgi:hypothetical protein